MNKCEILLVEDEPLSAEFILLFLKEEGYIIHHSLSCKEARILAQKHNITVVITDIELPDGSGLQLARDLLQKNSKITIIGVTGYDRAQIKQLGEDSSVLHAFLTKPIDLGVLLDTIRASVTPL